MKNNLLLETVIKKHKEGRRLVAPLMGFPGLQLTGSTIKIAQQNYSEHFKVLKALYQEFKPDLVFPLMDLSVEANALGRYTLFPKTDSATVVKDEFDFTELEYSCSIDITGDSRVLSYAETLKLMKNFLPGDVFRGAYVTGPYTLAALIMGAEEAAVSTLLNPEGLHKVCALAVQKISDYINLLVNNGAQVICILEPSAVMLGPDQFREFSAEYVSKLIRDDVISVYHICGNSMHLIEIMASSGVKALSLDSPEAGIDMTAAAEMIPEDIVLIGNINPTGKLLRGTPSMVEEEVNGLLAQMKPFHNFILSTGCDLPQETPLNNIHAFINAGREYNLDYSTGSLN